MSAATEPVNFSAKDHSSWRSAVSKVAVTADMEMPSGHTFEGRIRSSSVFDLGIFSMRCKRHAAHRSAAQTKDRRPEVVVTMAKNGNLRLRQNGREARVHTGEFTVYTSYDPVEINSSDDYQTIAVRIPVSRCRADEEQFRELSAQSFAADQGLAPAVWSLTEQLEAGPAAGTMATLSRASHHIIGLLEQMLHQQLGKPTPAETPAETILQSCRRYIETHLQDPELTPQRVAESNFISTRYLHMVFQQSETTVAAYIRERRLESIRGDLADPHLHQLSIDAIARKWGFHNVSHFGQLFKKAYGCPPAQYRREAFGC